MKKNSGRGGKGVAVVKAKNYSTLNPFEGAKRIPATRNGSPPAFKQFLLPLQLTRLRQDISMWRAAVTEMEHPYWPHRVRAQQLFQDTILNGHVSACMDKRKDLTLLKEFAIVDDNDIEKPELTNLFKKKWFYDVQSYILDARFFGYSLINMYNIMNDEFKNIEIVRRANVSPDREEISPYYYSIAGLDFMNSDLTDWCLWIPTPSDLGVSKCGYGILYKAAPYEIFCRNILGQNANFVELFGQPLRVLKTSKKEGDERDLAEAAVRDMGSSAYAVLDPEDMIEFVESAKTGTGWQSYANFELRCEKKISKLLLGHADAMDSTPGKLGSSDGENAPAQIALQEKQSADKTFMECVINDQLIPKMRNLGFQIPQGVYWRIKNDDERRQIINQENKTNQETANFVYTLKQAGLKVDMKWLSDKMGIPLEEVEEVIQMGQFPPNFQNRLKSIYSHVKNKV